MKKNLHILSKINTSVLDKSITHNSCQKKGFDVITLGLGEFNSLTCHSSA